jgi:hypothetical protein
MQLTADQQVELSITGQDAYGNSVDVSGDTEWHSSDDSIVSVQGNGTSATATAVGPAGTAAVTVSNDVDQDGTGDFQGSLAIDVVSGRIAEIRVQQGQVTDKQGNPVEQPPVDSGAHPDNTLPGDLPGGNYTPGDHVDNTLPNPDDQPHPDISGPGDQPVPDEGNLPYVDPRSRRK